MAARRETKQHYQARVRFRKLRTPEQREAAIQKLIRKPPVRISEKVVKARKARAKRTYPGTWIRELWREQKGTCFYCKVRMDRMTVDHYVPLSRGGRNERANVVGACEPCNAAKADLLPDEFTPPSRPFGLQSTIVEAA